jgi:hypothetical protein
MHSCVQDKDYVTVTVAFFDRVVPFPKSMEFNHWTLTLVPSEAPEQRGGAAGRGGGVRGRHVVMRLNAWWHACVSGRKLAQQCHQQPWRVVLLNENMCSLSTILSSLTLATGQPGRWAGCLFFTWFF